MKTGKLDASALLSQVFPYTGCKREEVILRAAIGEDSAAIELDDWCCVFSSDPITGAVSDNGWLAVHVSCNDVASNGAEPVGVMLTILMPESASDQDVEAIMQSADRAAGELGIEIIGGHTEFTAAVAQPVLCSTAIGKVQKSQLVASSGARPGDDIIVTKGAGIEGTAILALDYEDYLKNKMPAKLLENAKGFMQLTSVVPEGLLAAKLQATAMHDVTEGGILGALYEVAEASGVGIEIYQDHIPVLPETRAICEIIGIDPLKLISSGAMLITIGDGNSLIEALKEKGIDAAIIGKVVEGKRKVLLDGSREVVIAKPESDELWRAKKIIEIGAINS